MARVTVSKNYSLPIFADGTAHYNIIDTATGDGICSLRFPLPTPNGPLDKPEWFQAQKAVAQAIADALDTAPDDMLDEIFKAKVLADEMRDAARESGG